MEAPGVDEVSIEPWPLLYRMRKRFRRLAGGARVANRWAVLAVVLAGLFTVSFTITLLAVSLVDIADDLGSTPSALSWAITGPMLAFGVVGPAAGKLGDTRGHKRVFVVALLGAAVFAVATALAWNAWSLILFRTLSASAGSATGPSSMAIINRLFDADERVRALGFWSFVSAGAPVLGVVAGGPLVEAIGWRVIFAVQAPLCLAGALVALLLLPETERVARARFDVAGAALLALTVTTLLVAVNRGPTWGWTSPGVLLLFVATPVAAAAWVAVERRAVEPLVPLEWLRRRNLVAAVLSQLFANFAYMGGFILTPVLLEDVLGYTTGEVGLLIIARPLAFSLAAPTAGFVTVRTGERWSGAVGAAIVGVSMVGLAAIGPGSSPLFIVGALALSGIGLGVSSPAMSATVANAVDDDDLGAAGALQQLMVQVGAVVGVQVMQSIQSATEDSAGLVASYGNAYLVGAVMCGLAVLAALTIRSGRLRATAGALEEPVLSPRGAS